MNVEPVVARPINTEVVLLHSEIGSRVAVQKPQCNDSRCNQHQPGTAIMHAPRPRIDGGPSMQATRIQWPCAVPEASDTACSEVRRCRMSVPDRWIRRFQSK